MLAVPRAVVAASKFAPLGKSSAGGALPQLKFRSFPAAEANAAVNDATMVIVQFKSAEAIDKAEEIASVEGVDMVLIGANNLLVDLGLAGQFEHPKVRDVYAQTSAAWRKYGKHVGVGGLSTRPKLASDFITTISPSSKRSWTCPDQPRRRGGGARKTICSRSDR
jgi:2-keto-3-deoxy-L-rhamnonate aldolase RhmA